jgi:hypothetical protein
VISGCIGRAGGRVHRAQISTLIRIIGTWAIDAMMRLAGLEVSNFGRQRLERIVWCHMIAPDWLFRSSVKCNE